MIIAIDTETYVKKDNEYHAVLDSRKFFRGCITYEDMTSEVFKTKEEMWNKILTLGIKCKNKRQVLNVYGHYHEYDFYGYANWKSKNLTYYNNRPFIVSYKDPEGHEYIKFLDSMSIWKGSLRKLGKLIGLEKGQLQLIIKEWEIPEMEQYMVRDSEIVMKAMLYAKEFLKKEKIGVRRIFTISQIAISYMLKKLSEQQKTINVKVTPKRTITQTNMFKDKEMKQIWETKNKTEIHNAYKGGRVEVWKTGTITGVNSVDINSMYPYCQKYMRFPNLRTEQRIENPMETMGNDFLDYIGVSKVMIKNVKDDIGLLQIKTVNDSYIGQIGQIIIGTWTNQEIKEALRNGYKLISCEYTIIYQDDINPFSQIIDDLFEYKKNTNNEVERDFYKGILNRSIGKFGQRISSQEIVIDNIEKTKEYIENGYKMIRGLDYDIMFKKVEKEHNYKTYYCPIIPVLINADARIMLYKYLKKIPKKDLVYCDTDSIKFVNNHFDKFTISEEIGDWKIENTNDLMICYGSKTYLIGDEIKVAGFHRSGITKEDFIKGIIKSKKMVTINTTNNEEEVGMQKEEVRDLNLQEENLVKIKEMMKQQRIHIDYDLNNIDFFLKNISQINL